jgi:methionyl-tRNA formyltransferase
MIEETVAKIETTSLKPQKQDEDKVTFSPIIKKTDGEILFQEYHAKNIEQAARAFTPWPGVYTHWKSKKLELFELEVLDIDIKPGTVACLNEKIVIGTAKGAVAPGYLKLEGKKKQTAKEFLCGYRDFVGSILN